MVPLRAVFRRLDVCLNSFVDSSVYTQMYNTLFWPGRSVFIELVDEPGGQFSENFVSPFCSFGSMTVPVQFVFSDPRICHRFPGVYSRFPCSTTIAFPEIDWDARTCSSYLHVCTTRFTTSPIKLDSKMAKSHSHCLHAQIFDCVFYGGQFPEVTWGSHEHDCHAKRTSFDH